MSAASAPGWGSRWGSRAALLLTHQAQPSTLRPCPRGLLQHRTRTRATTLRMRTSKTPIRGVPRVRLGDTPFTGGIDPRRVAAPGHPPSFVASALRGRCLHPCHRSVRTRSSGPRTPSGPWWPKCSRGCKLMACASFGFSIHLLTLLRHSTPLTAIVTCLTRLPACAMLSATAHAR